MSALLPIEDALERLLAGAGPLAAETIPISEAAWRVLAQDVSARRTQPPFDASAMDGYAVRSADLAQTPVRLKMIGEAAAGRGFKGEVGAGEAVRIFTGAPVPAGADAVLIQENAAIIQADTIEALEPVSRQQNIRRQGLDFSRADILLKAGRTLDPGALSLAASGNHAELTVVRRPRIALLATGDELLPPGSAPGPDQIISSNAYGVAAVVRALGADVLDLGIVRDDEAQIAAAIERAQHEGADVLVTMGGVSVGDHDLVRAALVASGMSLDFWKIAMRPGKPLMFGKLRNLRVLGLPGNPVASLVCSHVFLAPLVARLAGRRHSLDWRDAVLNSAMKANDKRQDYVRAFAWIDGDRIRVEPHRVQDSSMLRTLADSNALIVREPFAPAATRDAPCRIIVLRPLDTTNGR